MSWLVDGNVLVASLIDTHVHHQRARLWFEQLTERFTTCAVTQGTLLRMHMKFADDHGADAAWKALAGVEAHPLHDYLDEDLPYRDVPYARLQGHREVTDAWIVELARRNSSKVATLDAGLVASYPDDAVLI